MARQFRRAFEYRSSPTGEQAAELSRTFGCVRLVRNRAPEGRTPAGYGEQRRVSYARPSAALTVWKRAQPLDIRRSRPLPEGAVPATVTVSRARNTLAAGPAAAACGDGVGPQPESSRTGRSSVKQEARRVTAGIPRHHIRRGRTPRAAPSTRQSLYARRRDA
ncbi:hypothetical protein SSP531S_40680 [Streptomyces spongiicola]|uniref:Transposase putative helix-turn-helix domain-containing protein n=1 Tax=Streptomyces spongiicola TaxID=1690221 RepID=A0A388T1F9_9ACTN|nr:hypothetical protein SSP531S_40680 [Streptomyces spongiicola]